MIIFWEKISLFRGIFECLLENCQTHKEDLGMVRIPPPRNASIFTGFVIFWQYFQTVKSTKKSWQGQNPLPPFLGNASNFRPIFTVTLPLEDT